MLDLLSLLYLLLYLLFTYKIIFGMKSAAHSYFYFLKQVNSLLCHLHFDVYFKIVTLTLT